MSERTDTLVPGRPGFPIPDRSLRADVGTASALVAEGGRDDRLFAVGGDGDRSGRADLFAKFTADTGIGVDLFRKERETAEYLLQGAEWADEVVEDLRLIAERQEDRQGQPDREDRNIHMKHALPDDHRRDRDAEGDPCEIAALEPLGRRCGLDPELFTEPFDGDHQRVHRADVSAVQPPENDRDQEAYSEQCQPDKDVSLDQEEDEQGQEQYADDGSDVFHDAFSFSVKRIALAGHFSTEFRRAGKSALVSGDLRTTALSPSIS